jgi:hypothetical protein
MITIPTFLFITQWALLCILGVLVVLMYRQLAQYLGIRADRHEHGLAPGSPAPEFDYRDVREPTRRHRFVPGGGTPALVVFADPSCVACEEAMTRLTEAMTRSGDGAGVRVLVATTESERFVAGSPAFSRLPASIGLIGSEAQERYHVDASPYFFAIDADGRVTNSGTAWSMDQITMSLGEGSTNAIQTGS